MSIKENLIATIEEKAYLKFPERASTYEVFEANIWLDALQLINAHIPSDHVLVKESEIKELINKMDSKFSDCTYVGMNYTKADAVNVLKAMISEGKEE